MNINEFPLTKDEKSEINEYSFTKSIIGAIPSIGTAINEAVYGRHDAIKLKQLEKFVLVLTDLISDASWISELKEYLESDEFSILSTEIFEKAVKTTREEKRNLYANIYIKSIRDQIDYEQSSVSSFISFIDLLKPEHFSILKFTEEKKQELTQIGSYSALYNLYIIETGIKIGQDYFKFYMNELIRMALVTAEGGLEDFNDKRAILYTAEDIPSSVYLTEVGQDFLTYLIV